MNMLREWMKARKMTAADMAALISGEPGSPHTCTTRAVQNWMQGQRTPSKHFIERIHEVTAGAVPVSSWFETPVITPERAVAIAWEA